MKRMDAIGTVKGLLKDADLTSEQKEAAEMALNALETPECMSCGYCQKFADEDAEGQGWCEEHDREALCDDKPCGYYE